MNDIGPQLGELRPYVFEALRASRMSADDMEKVLDFCKAVGFRLLGDYPQDMVKQKGWTMWPYDKHSHAALGMHGLGLARAFGHSIPKASLPLLSLRQSRAGRQIGGLAAAAPEQLATQPWKTGKERFTEFPTTLEHSGVRVVRTPCVPTFKG